MRRLLICITGMPGAGKTTVASALGSLGFRVVSMGDVVREEMKRRGLSSREEQLEFMKEIREELGPAAIAILSSRKIEDARDKVIVVDGVRSPDEIEYFRKLACVRVLAVHASPAKRFKYLRARARRDDPQSWEEFVRRDAAELSLRIGDVIALADGMLVNESLSRETLKKKAVEIVQGWVKDFEEGAAEGVCQVMG